MAVPASYNDLLADPRLRDHVGEVWYQRTVRVPRGWAGRAGRAVLRVGHAPGHRVGRRRGGGPARGRLHAVRGRRHRGGAGGRAGADHRLRRQHAELPDHPARRRRADPGGPKQRYWHDFYNYAGLHRTVWLACTPAARIEDITVVTGLDGTTGTVDYRVDATGADGLDVRVVLRDADGRDGRHADRCGRRGDRARRPPLGTRRRLPVRPGGPAVDPDRRARRQLPPERRRAHGRGPRYRVPHQRRAVPVHRVRHARGPPDPRQGPQPRVPRPGLRAAGVDRGQLVPDVALPLLRGRPRPRRPARHRGDRRDRGGRAEHGSGRRHLRRAGLPDLQRRHHQRRRPGRCTPRRSASSSRATRTTRASCCGRSPTSPSRRPRRRRTTSARCSTWPARPTRPGRWGSST